ncbi:MAG: hypothetical protein ABSF47_03050 [Minisyncoccia bacterium]
MKNEGLIYFVIVILAFLVLGGFYFVFDKLSSLNTEVKNVELNYQLASKGSVTTPAPSTTSTSENGQNNSGNQNPTTPGTSDIVVPTGIIFTVSSTPALQPQSPITITMDNVTKKSDGTIVVTLKVFTSQAGSYSAIDPTNFIQYVSLDSSNQIPTNVSPIFDSMPPKSVVTGTVSFQLDPSKSVIILQVGQGDNPKFYEINFGTGTYKETVIG